MAVTAAVAAVTTAVAGVAASVVNYEQGNAAAQASKDLANSQADALNQQQAQAAALAAQEATSGQTFGFPTGSEGQPAPLNGIMTGIGFDTAPKTSANEGSQSVTGMN